MKRALVMAALILALITACSKKEAAVKSMEGQDAATLLERGNRALNQGKVEDALEAYNIIYTRYPTSREYISAVLGMASTYNSLGDFERGFGLLYNLIRENMVPSRVPEIYNEMAKYYEVTAVYSKEAGISQEEEDYQKAISFYRKSVDYPNSDDAKAKSYAQFQIGELNLKMTKYEDAALAYQATVYKFPGTEWASLAEQRMSQLQQQGQTNLSPIKKAESPTEQPSSTMPESSEPGQMDSTQTP